MGMGGVAAGLAPGPPVASGLLVAADDRRLRHRPGAAAASWPAVALAPVIDWADAWQLLAAHAILRAGLLVAPVAVPAGLAIGGLAWAWRIYAVTTGLAGQTASAPVWFDERQWRHQVRSARGRAAAPAPSRC